MDLILAYVFVGWLVAFVFDIGLRQNEPVYYGRIIPFWPVLLLALLICWVHDIWVES